MRTGYTVADVMTKNPVTCNPDISLTKAAQLMIKREVGSLLVVDGFLVGMLTEKQLVRKVAESAFFDTLTVKDCMTPTIDLVTVNPEKDIYDAILLMKKSDKTKLPVVKHQNMQGIITAKDILKVKSSLIDLIQDNIRIREEDRKLGL